MSSTVRILNDAGITAFRQFLASLASGGTGVAPAELMNSDETSEPWQAHVQLDAARKFGSKLAVAEYLDGAFHEVNQKHVSHNGGLWSWLALYYLDELLPLSSDGSRRKPLAEAHYVFASRGGQYDWRTYYRHLLATPYDIYRRYGSAAGVLLCGPVYSHGDWLEQLGSRQEMITSDGLIEAVNALYLDPHHSTAERCWKRGSLASADRAGSLRRFIRLIGQLDLTYDLYGMEAREILGLLPDEFRDWLPS